ncbi:hypothetical protein Lal_00022469 [Lupinus albus]|nr:hypothetical protein Lal_00022469 [Lupinus albus]
MRLVRSIWNREIFIDEDIRCGTNFMLVKGKWTMYSEYSHIMNVYCPCDLEGKQKFWEEAKSTKLGYSRGMWYIKGNFNVILQLGERKDWIEDPIRVKDHIRSYFETKFVECHWNQSTLDGIEFKHLYEEENNFLTTKFEMGEIKDAIWSSSGDKSSGLDREMITLSSEFLTPRQWYYLFYNSYLLQEVMIATVDNPSNALEWGLAEMLNQPEILKKATEELDNVVGKGRLVQELDFPKLNYVKACAREAFRLHPIVDFNVAHVAMSDTIVANYFIPKGSHILIRRQGVGQNPNVWKEPLKFKPERHLKSDGSNLVLTEPSLNLLTFSTGRRSCPGIMLGTSMTIMLFARLLHGFIWSVPPNESCIDLSESEGGTTKAKSLLAFAKPRLSPEVYGIC